jgi:hypothetical protein
MNKEQTFNVGDFVTGYEKGYWKISSIRERSYTSALVTLDKIFNGNGSKASGRLDSGCDIGYCRKVDEAFINKQFEEELIAATIKRDALLKYLKEQEND